MITMEITWCLQDLSSLVGLFDDTRILNEESTLLTISPNKTTIQNKEQGSQVLTFDLHCKALDTLLSIPYIVVLFEDITTFVVIILHSFSIA